MKVTKYRPMKGRKDYECILCSKPIRKGYVHMLVSLDDGGQWPVQKRVCYGCFDAGKIERGTEIAA